MDIIVYMKRIAGILTIALVFFCGSYSAKAEGQAVLYGKLLQNAVLLKSDLISAKAEGQAVLYGKLLQNAVLLKSDSKEAIATLPETYYVTITSQDETYYYVTYNNINGAIDKAFIEQETREPVAKFASLYFTAEKDLDTLNPTLIHAEPTWGSDTTGTISYHEKAFLYGSIDGEAKKGTDNVLWYYVRFGDSYGYVHSLEGIADTFYPNNGLMIEQAENNDDYTSAAPLGKIKTEWIYALALSVPVVAIMFKLFKKRKTIT